MRCDTCSRDVIGEVGHAGWCHKLRSTTGQPWKPNYNQVVSISQSGRDGYNRQNQGLQTLTRRAARASRRACQQAAGAPDPVEADGLDGDAQVVDAAQQQVAVATQAAAPAATQAATQQQANEAMVAAGAPDPVEADGQVVDAAQQQVAVATQAAAPAATQAATQATCPELAQILQSYRAECARRPGETYAPENDSGRGGGWVCKTCRRPGHASHQCPSQR
jgi:hypothetical protein